MSQPPPLPTLEQPGQSRRFTDGQLRLAFWVAELVTVGCIAFIPHIYSTKETWQYFLSQHPVPGVIAYWAVFQLSVISLIILGVTFFAMGRLRVRAFISIVSGIVGWLIYFMMTND